MTHYPKEAYIPLCGTTEKRTSAVIDFVDCSVCLHLHIKQIQRRIRQLKRESEREHLEMGGES
jgi:hypothetical protein